MITFSPRSPQYFPDWRFDTLDFTYDPDTQSAWMSYKADGPPHYTFQTLVDTLDVRESLRALYRSAPPEHFPVRYFVMASNQPGIFKLGGDLAEFADCIRRGDSDTLTAYAHACIDSVHGLVNAFDLPIVTLSLVNGQALGGGLEGALAQHFLMAEEGAKLGVPEVSFNTFPGMGAVSLLSRRVGQARAEAIIASGQTYSARQMFSLGVVDFLAPSGHGNENAREWMAEGGDARFQRRLALTQARRRFFPVSRQELIDITDLWVSCCLNLTPADLRHMDRLVGAQRRMSLAAMG
ncbi:MAG TPA: crotonase/enoyl-CoA hydratase family protein [Caulobacteraceae bacterium]